MRMNKENTAKSLQIAPCGKVSVYAEAACGITDHEGRWCLDLDASSHMIADNKKLKGTWKSNDRTLNLTSTDLRKITDVGIVKARGSDELTVKLEETFLVSTLHSNLLAVEKMTDCGLIVTFDRDRATVTNPNTEKK
ncbi:hypothetical protein KM043_017096 [Ampulex compressa]|nr:hypothetical protein KM043_017096 [Ampulex compressa]